MTNAFTRKLKRFADFNDEEMAALERLSAQPERVERGRDLIRQGDRPESIHLLISGWAFRYKVLADGSRQIVGYLIPGDLGDLQVTLLGEMDHSIGLLSDAEVVAIPQERIHEIMERHRRIERALWRVSLVDAAILREWVVNIGRRDAFSRMGHHLCELWHRMMSVGLVGDGDQFDLPLTQEELADSLGLTPVHTNRILKRLREEGLIALRRKKLAVLDPQRLTAITGFDPGYLHLKKRVREPRNRSRLS